MKILLLNQAFHPDVVATGQHATDLALKLVSTGHQVTVVTSRRAYDDSQKQFAPREIWRGIRIIRLGLLGLGKSSRWRRAADFASFFANCLLRTLLLPRADLVIALTSPPLISALGALLVRIKGGKFVFWVMDLNPDEAIAAGWIRADSQIGRLLSAILNFSLRHSDRLIALDRFMAQRLVAKGVPERKIVVIPPWSQDETVVRDPLGREAFRREHRLDGKFVVMYSGNHSPCHPLDTVLDAADRLGERADIAFCFVGGGSEFRKVRDFARARNLQNIRCIPYQPLDKLSASLSAADLHLVVMGDPFVGIVHPCKVYNIRQLCIPFLYIGPEPSHVTELAPAACFRHGDVDAVVGFLSSSATHPIPASPPANGEFSQQALLTRMVEAIHSTACEKSSPGPIADCHPVGAGKDPVKRSQMSGSPR
jgi:colanic acid biosynthesis glycosyl transferase WcaI